MATCTECEGTGLVFHEDIEIRCDVCEGYGDPEKADAELGTELTPAPENVVGPGLDTEDTPPVEPVAAPEPQPEPVVGPDGYPLPAETPSPLPVPEVEKGDTSVNASPDAVPAPSDVAATPGASAPENAEAPGTQAPEAVPADAGDGTDKGGYG